MLCDNTCEMYYSQLLTLIPQELGECYVMIYVRCNNSQLLPLIPHESGMCYVMMHVRCNNSQLLNTNTTGTRRVLCDDICEM